MALADGRVHSFKPLNTFKFGNFFLYKFPFLSRQSAIATFVVAATLQMKNLKGIFIDLTLSDFKAFHPVNIHGAKMTFLPIKLSTCN